MDVPATLPGMDSCSSAICKRKEHGLRDPSFANASGRPLFMWYAAFSKDTRHAATALLECGARS